MTGPNCSSVTTRSDGSGSTTIAGRTKLPPFRSPPGSSPNSQHVGAGILRFLDDVAVTNFFWAPWCSGPIVVPSSRP